MTVGPLYSKRQAFDQLQLSALGEIGWLTKNKCILSLTTADGAQVWPAFQFYAGLIRPAIGPILWTFAPIDPDPWTLAAWMNTYDDGLGETPAESRDSAAVILAVGDAISRWRSRPRIQSPLTGCTSQSQLQSPTSRTWKIDHECSIAA